MINSSTGSLASHRNRVLAAEPLPGRSLSYGRAGENSVDLSIDSDAAKKLFEEIGRSKKLKVQFSKNDYGQKTETRNVGPLSCMGIIEFELYNCTMILKGGTPVEQ